MKKNPKKNIKFFFFASKLKQFTKLSDEEDSDSEFYYPEEQETAKRNFGRHFDKVEASGDIDVKS